MRGTYSIGILNYCLENNINFDCCIGVSAGSLNLINFLSKQKGRNYKYYFDYAFRKEYSGLNCFFKEGSYLNLKYIYETLPNSNGENPLDYKTLMENPTDFIVVAEECVSGETKYFTKQDIKQDNYKILSASCNIPIMNRPVEIDGMTYYDGGFADPVPIKKAFDEGCDKVILIVTRPIEIPRKSTRDKIFAKMLKLKYPKAAERLANRAKTYNDSIELAKKMQEEGNILILSPKNVYGLDTLTRNKESMEKLYQDGKKAGEKLENWLKNF